MLKTKFEFNYLEKTLYIQPPGSPRQAITKTFTTNWCAPGFILEPANHWITFTVWETKIRAFYKHVKEDDSVQAWPSELDWKDWKVSAETLAPISQIITYYQKDLEVNSKIKDFSQKNALYLTKTNSISFTFEPADEVHKVNGVWVKKSN